MRRPRPLAVARRVLARAGVGLGLAVAVLAAGPALVLADRDLGSVRHWYEADRSSAGLAPTPSGTGYQASLYGLAGIGLGGAEGLEVNVLGLVVGVDPGELALELPGIGRVGPATAAAAG